MAGTADISPKTLDPGQHFGSGSGIVLAGGCEPCTAHGGAQLALQAPGLFISTACGISFLYSADPPSTRSHLEYGPTGILPFTKEHQHSPVAVAQLSFPLLLPRGLKP